jgi:2-phospho-L-lactate/phosphoenolpyruvate guanylyltransferase
MTWTAIVPLKAAAERKTRLAGTLDRAAHSALARDMVVHVIAVLASVDAIGSLRVLSPVPEDLPGTVWEADRGAGLNAELDRVCGLLAGLQLLIIHADLPLLGADDVIAMLEAAETAGAAIAPDRHGKGTNALALHRASAVGFAFGPDSLARHMLGLPGAAIIRREGLALDIDTADDIAAAGGALPLGRWCAGGL